MRSTRLCDSGGEEARKCFEPSVSSLGKTEARVGLGGRRVTSSEMAATKRRQGVLLSELEQRIRGVFVGERQTNKRFGSNNLILQPKD